MATIDKVNVDLMVVLGTSTMPIHQVMRLSRGAIIELDATEADEVKILANNLPIASGVVLVDRNRIAVEVKRMLPRTDRRMSTSHLARCAVFSETAAYFSGSAAGPVSRSNLH